MKNKLKKIFSTCFLILLASTLTTLLATNTPTASKRIVDGEPINLLIISSTANNVPLIDPHYEKELKSHGYNIEVMGQDGRLTLPYLKQFGAVIFASLPYDGEEYTVYGYKNQHFKDNITLLKEYVQLGGGLLIMPAISEFGEAYGKTYNNFLEEYGASLLIQQLKDGSSLKNQKGTGAYGVGTIKSEPSIGKQLKGKKVLYPMNVMRWDHAYSCTPLLIDKNWLPLATADGGTTHIAINNTTVADELSKNNILYAIRKTGKGMLGLSALHSYYTLTMVSSTNDHIGENGTGVIDFKVMNGEKDGRQSYFGELIDQTLRSFAENSKKNSIGIWKDIPQPTPTPLPTSTTIIDWQTQKLPPTWAHRVIPSDGWPRTYDELPDPLAKGAMKYWKMLIGIKSNYSNGSGTVKEYREAAIQAGYSAIAFTETFENLSPEKWEKLLAECKTNSDETFVCLPGIDILSTEGQRYLVVGADRYPSPDWLTEDGKTLAAIRMLSLGWFGHITIISNPEHSPLHYKTFKHYTGISVATYNNKGELIDDGMKAYHWAQSVDSSAIPIAVHEINSPKDIKNATVGYQQILPAPTLEGAIHYFRYGFSHNFDDPMRYFISEGPILNGWSIFNKDKGKPEENRTQFKMQIGVRSNDSQTPITSIKLYDEFELVRDWKNSTTNFRTIFNGHHNKQHCYLLVAADAKGRKVISPLIRTVSRNWRLRCGDKQNWLGSQLIYTGWWLNGLPGYNLQIADSNEGDAEDGVPIIDFPFFSDHVQINDADMSFHYAFGERKDVAGDGTGMLPMVPNDMVDGNIRYTLFTDMKQKDFTAMLVETTIKLKEDAELKLTKNGINPAVGTHSLMRWNNKLILPNESTDKLGKTIDSKTQKAIEGNPDNMNIELPVGSYAGGIIPLSAGIHINGRNLGLKTKPGVQPAGKTWTAKYLMLRDKQFRWKSNRGRGFNHETVDRYAEQALTEMGFRGKTPYTFKLNQGSLIRTEYIAYLNAKNGGIGGKNINKSQTPMLMYVPMIIAGLDTDSVMVLWRSDSKYLEFFAAYNGQGYLSFNADKNVRFYAGNAAICNPDLAVSLVNWTKDSACFHIHNPTHKTITSNFATAKAIKGFKQLSCKITVPPGETIELKTEK
jgi:hypothetical protein